MTITIIGFDSTVAWWSCFLTFGSQSVLEAAERRLQEAALSPSVSRRPPPLILTNDIEHWPEGYLPTTRLCQIDSPFPAPEVLDILKYLVGGNSRDMFAGRAIMAESRKLISDSRAPIGKLFGSESPAESSDERGNSIHCYA
jgi:hypothetical protein